MSSSSELHIHQAHQLAREFAQRNRPGAFHGIDRLEVFDALDRRIDHPHLIYQGNAGVCGPSMILYTYALHDRAGYTKLVTDLFEHGRGKLRHWELTPSRHLRHHRFSHKAHITPADWIALASIRDCENWFFDFQAATDKGSTPHEEMADIFRKAGFRHVKDHGLDFTHAHQKLSHHRQQQLIDLLREAGRLRDDGYSVGLLIDAGILKDKEPIGHHNHWVALASSVAIVGGTCNFKVFTWGRLRYLSNPPTVPCQVEELVDYFYGFVAGKY